MKTRLYNLWEKLRISYWFIPALMALGALLLAYGVGWLDEFSMPDWLLESRWLHKSEPEGARQLLSTVAGGIITVTGVVFSVTIVALSLASQQFGPRLLYNFRRDRGNQVAFGTFVATYLYCLLVLRTIREGNDAFVPHLSVFVGFLLTVISLGVLIYFIHHVAESIQATTIISLVHDDLKRKIDTIFPDPYNQAPVWEQRDSEEQIPDNFTQMASAIRAARTGYLQAIDVEGLMQIACEYDLLVQYEHRPGHYVIRGSAIARVVPRVDEEETAWQESVRDSFIIGWQRTQEQDIEFLIHELVEIAVRALSPSINDPHTAIACVDRLGSSLAELAGRAMPSAYLHDEEGVLRIITRPHNYRGLVDASFDQIRQYGMSSVALTIRLLEMIGAILPFAPDEARRAPLLRQAAMIDEISRRAFPDREDTEEIHGRYLTLMKIL